MKLLNLMKRDEKYLSWEEYKQRLVEIQVMNLVSKLIKSNTSYTDNDLHKITRTELARFSQI
ncbi:hypothetical protein HYX16_06560 [Candidatus Woesearchaeota archaeon]|nr:hypothetical protein [Candidatus Woesearchaeota archaeon]